MKTFTLTLIAFFSVLNIHAQTAEEVIKSHVAYIGGEKAWKTIKTLTMKGEYDYGGMKFPFTSFAKAPNKYKFVVPLNDKFYAQAYDGSKGWKIDAFKNETTPTLLTGAEALKMANESDVELESAFIDYKLKGHKAELEKMDTVIQEKTCIKVSFTRKNAEKEVYYFDNKTYGIVMKTAVSKNAEMGGSVLTTFVSDYRIVNGIKIPFKQESVIGSQAILTITVGKVELNNTIDDKEFKP